MHYRWTRFASILGKSNTLPGSHLSKQSFRGNHESNGAWRIGGLPSDVEDIRIVAAYLTTVYGYVIDLVVGHSRGAIASMNWVATSEEGKGVTGYVNVAGRYRLEVSFQFLQKLVFRFSYQLQGIKGGDALSCSLLGLFIDI
jgi:hypothetical protein